jgi:phosphinothricin acetyltransferase
MIISFEDITENDYPSIEDIYLQGIETQNATFQTISPTWNVWNASHLAHSRIAAFECRTLVAWAALSPISSRSVYSGVAEVSIYVASNAQGKGIGFSTLQHLIKISEENGIWMLQSSVFPENLGSINLHEKCGFRVVGFREKIGQMDNIWRNNLLLERRSRMVGSE